MPPPEAGTRTALKDNEWLKELEGELVPVRCGNRKGLLARSRDVRALRTKPPTASAKWPLRLLPRWDTLLMCHADKSWTVPDDADRKRIWRKGAFVTATVLARGRIVATWTHKKRAKRIDVEVEPLSRWSSKLLTAVRRAAEAVAKFMGVEHAEVSVQPLLRGASRPTAL